jgi:hypothetical protein
MIERKVTAATGGAGAAGLIDWALATYLFPHLHDPTGQALILAAVPGVLAFAAGWLAKHTPRPTPAPAVDRPTGGVTVLPPAPGGSA